MNKTGIIYKFTIIAKYKYNENKPFYIGQHWTSKDVDYFINKSDYIGSGSIWNDILKRIKKDYPKIWYKFIRREVLWSSVCSQKALDKMEEYYIKKERSHYSNNNGGTNVLPGTANVFGAGSPVLDPMVRKKISKSRKGKCVGEEHFLFGKHWSDEIKIKNSNSNKGKQKGERHWNYGNHWREEVKAKISESNKGNKKWLGKHHSEETKIKLSKHFSGKKWKDSSKRKMSISVSGAGNPMYGKTRINNGIINSVINRGDIIPEGWIKGVLCKMK